jgi:predicted nucleotidyltransferase component of viral defense system
MSNFFGNNREQAIYFIRQTANKMGLPPQAIEKDLWVTTLLQIVFLLPFADNLVFKGGTSLSKIWRVIERFSEDIDLAIDRDLFDLHGDLTIK